MRSFKSYAISLYANKVAKDTRLNASRAIIDQDKWLLYLLSKGKTSLFGQDHNFTYIKSHKEFASAVPIRTYEQLRPYIEKIMAGDKNVLWKGQPKYFAKTSGTTSGIKYIPISQESIKQHIKTASKAIFNYIAKTKEPVLDGKVMFISGSPSLIKKSGISTGRLSGIVNHEIPAWLKPGQLPSYTTNCIGEWEDKLDKIVEETKDQDLRLISGIPPWVQMYYERLLERTRKKNILEVFPNLKLFIHGGVNYAPYKDIITQLHGTDLPNLETYPASEGFIAYQDDYKDPGLLLNTNAGMFFEFVPLAEIDDQSPNRLSLREVELNKDYVILISSNAGLWAYNLGDTVRFVSLNPFKLKVSGRVKHFISAFGEHVIAKEVEEAMTIICQKYSLSINEFTVAPQISPAEGGLPYHEWFVEFNEIPNQLELIASDLDNELARQNIYYQDLLLGKILQPLKIKPVKRNGFRRYLASQGKLGGQNKVPRLMNTRVIADKLSDYT